MSQPTGQSYHYQGPVVVYTGTGSAGAGEALGVSEDGVDIRIEEFLNPVHSDAAGGLSGPPAEFQKIGYRVKIRMRLASYDDAVLQHILSRGDRTSAGMLNSPGIFVHTNSYGFKLGLSGGGSGFDDPWYFPTVTLAANAPAGAKLGTKNTMWDMEFDAIAYLSGASTSGKDKVLWARAYPGGFPS